MSSHPPSNPWQTMWIVWGALLGSIGAYVAVIQLVEVQAERVPSLPIVLGVAALGVGGLSFWLPRRLLSLANLKAAVEEVPDPNASVMFRDQTPMIRVFAEPAAAEKEIALRFYTPFILSVAMSEAVAVFGLVLALLGEPPPVWAPFMGAGVVLVALRAPVKSRILARAEALSGVRFAPR